MYPVPSKLCYEMCYATQVRCSIGFIRVLARGKAPSSQRSTLGTRTWTVSDRVCEITAAQLFQSMASLKTALAREPNRTRSCQQLPTTRTLQQNHFSRCQTFRKDKCFKIVCVTRLKKWHEVGLNENSGKTSGSHFSKHSVGFLNRLPECLYPRMLNQGPHALILNPMFIIPFATARPA